MTAGPSEWGRDVARRARDHRRADARYCRAPRPDRPPDRPRRFWHADGTADYRGIFHGLGSEFIDSVWQVHASFGTHARQLTNILIEVDGDRAISEAYVTVVLRGDPAGTGLLTLAEIGRYLDRWERRNGRWAISARVYVTDLPMLGQAADPAAITDARRDRTDPSGALFAGCTGEFSGSGGRAPRVAPPASARGGRGRADPSRTRRTARAVPVLRRGRRAGSVVPATIASGPCNPWPTKCRW